MNGYFRVGSTATSTELELFAPTDGGQPVKAQEIVAYLAMRAIRYDAGSLNKAIDQAAKADTKVTLNMYPSAPISEMSEISVEPDKMKAYVRLYAPSEGGTKLAANDIVSSLAARGVSSGLKKDVLEEIIDHPRFCEDILIAEAQYPGESIDGYVEYLFNTDRTVRPTQNEDGSVDFFHLNVVQSCGKGQEIARLHPAVTGENGLSLDGTIVKARVPKEAKFRYGNNIAVSDDGMSLIATTDGSITLISDQIFVNDALNFEEIGTATGNIEFEGSVNIKGNIATNFEVRVKGDVVVNGVIEGAYVEAGGNIIVARGVNGMGKAVLKAGGCIVAKYLENVDAQAGSYVRAEAIMHSTVAAGGDVIVDGKKGMISGGKVTAGGIVEVKNLGSEMANDTIIEVGASPLAKKEIMELRNTAAEKQKTVEQIKPVLSNLAMSVRNGAVLTNEQKAYAAKLMAVQKSTDEELARIMVRLAELEAVCDPDTPTEVKVKGTVYPGTRVCISEVSMAVKTATKYCKFVKLRGDVKITSYD